MKKREKKCKFHKKWQFHQANQNMMREFTCKAFGRCLLWLVALDVPLTCSNKFAWVVASIIYSVFSRSSFSFKGGGKVGQVVLLGKSTEKTCGFLWVCVHRSCPSSLTNCAKMCKWADINLWPNWYTIFVTFVTWCKSKHVGIGWAPSSAEAHSKNPEKWERLPFFYR